MKSDSDGHTSQISDSGQIVGIASVSVDQASQRAALWTDGEIIDLGSIGGDARVATDINNHGQVVGVSTTGDPDLTMCAFLW